MNIIMNVNLKRRYWIEKVKKSKDTIIIPIALTEYEIKEIYDYGLQINSKGLLL